MKVPALGLTVAACVALQAGGSSGAEYLKLVDFSNPEDTKGVAFNDFECKGTSRVTYDATRGCVTFCFSNVYGNLSIPAYNRRYKALAPDVVGDVFYFKYRAPQVDAKINLMIEATNNIYAAVTSFAEGPDLGFALAYPRKSWSRNRTPWDRAAHTGVYVNPLGSGALELYEAGLVVEPPKPPPPKRDWTPVATDAFRLFPEPRVFRRTDGAFTFPARCAFAPGALPVEAKRAFVRELRDFHGIELVEADTAPVVFELIGDARIKYDGFVIAAKPTGIRVKANEPAGLTWGAQALAELLWRADPSGRTLPSFELADWPRYRYRSWLDAVAGFGHVEKYDPAFYNARLKQFVLSARYNRVSLYTDSYYQFDSPHLLKLPQAWTRADLESIVDCCNGHGVRMMPFVQSLGHQDWFMLWQKEARARFGEDGEAGVLCTSNPETYPFLFGLFDEMIGVCSRNRGYEPEFFFIGCDEVRWLTASVPEEKRCRLCAGKAKNGIFRDHVNACAAYLRRKGMRTIISADMVARMHNGCDRFNCVAVLPQLDKDVVISPWSGLCNLSIDEFRQNGHDCWKSLTGFRDDPTGDDQLIGYGFGIFTFNWWLARIRSNDNSAYSPLAQQIDGYYAWRESPYESGDGAKMARKWGNFLMSAWSRKPIRGHGAYAPLKLEGGAASVKGFDLSVASVGGVPVALGKEVVATAGGVRLPVQKRAAALAFLHGTTFPSAGDEKAFFDPKNYRDWTKGPVIATVTVGYADGTSADIPMNYGWNVCDIASRGDGNRVMSRYLADCRFVLANATDDQVLYLYEWANPHPEKEISSLTLRASGDFPITYRLLAVSARTTEE